MKLENVSISVEERSFGRCIDMGMLFYREHLPSSLGILLVFALPFYLLASVILDLGGHVVHLLMLFTFIAPLGGASLIVAAGSRVFGETFSATYGLRALGKRFFTTLFLLFLRWLVFILFATCLVVPAALIGGGFGYFAEVILLEQVPLGKISKRQSALVRGRFVELSYNFLILTFFYSLACIAVFIVLDFALGILVGYPLLISRWEFQIDFFDEELNYFLFYDRRTLFAFFGVAWFLYPIWRYAWFFGYLDQRIRKESWDLDLDFRLEAQRLKGGV